MKPGDASLCPILGFSHGLQTLPFAHTDAVSLLDCVGDIVQEQSQSLTPTFTDSVPRSTRRAVTRRLGLLCALDISEAFLAAIHLIDSAEAGLTEEALRPTAQCLVRPPHTRRLCWSPSDNAHFISDNISPITVIVSWDVNVKFISLFYQLRTENLVLVGTPSCPCTAGALIEALRAEDDLCHLPKART